MKLGIVGSEGAKFNKETTAKAVRIIHSLIAEYSPLCVVSGHCHLGGIDIWAENAADHYRLEKLIFPPKTHTWSTGYKPRNLEIAEHSDVVVCITVASYIPEYKGMKFLDATGAPFCYHCGTKEPAHVKSGGCWTVKQARRMDKKGRIIIV